MLTDDAREWPVGDASVGSRATGTEHCWNRDRVQVADEPLRGQANLTPLGRIYRRQAKFLVAGRLWSTGPAVPTFGISGSERFRVNNEHPLGRPTVRPSPFQSITKVASCAATR